MKLVNRGFIWVRPKIEFWNWLSKHTNTDYIVDVNNSEGNIYLIEEDFFDFEPIIKKYFLNIFNAELTFIEDDIEFPEFTIELFLEWFELDLGSNVFDMLSKKIEKE